MAVVTLKSPTITNRDATPRVINDGRLEKSVSKATQGYVTTANGDSATSTYVVCSVPSTAVVQQILLSCGALGGSCAADVGVYYPTTTAGAAGAVVDADFFGSAVSLVSALNNSDVTAESGVYTIAKRQQPLWQATGLTADPGGVLDIVVTLTADTAAAAAVGLLVFYVDNGS